MNPKRFKLLIILMVLVGIALGASGVGIYLTGEKLIGAVLGILALPFLVISFSLNKFRIYLDFYSSVKNAGKK